LLDSLLQERICIMSKEQNEFDAGSSGASPVEKATKKAVC